MERREDFAYLRVAFGAELRERRKKLKLTKEAVAGIADITPTYLRKLERGAASPTLPVLCGLAQALNVSLVELLANTSALFTEQQRD